MSQEVRALIQSLIAAKACLATVESCTGGLLARRITEVNGCSAVYWGGWVTYDNSAKTSAVNVPPYLIEKYGAVSPEVARAMAEGGLRKMNEATQGDSRSRICVSTTGIAGPSGGTPTKAVGLCYVGVAALGQDTYVAELQGLRGNDRAANQSAFADAAFASLEKMIQRISGVTS